MENLNRPNLKAEDWSRTIAISSEFLKEINNIIGQEIKVAGQVPESISFYLKGEIKEISVKFKY